MIAQICLADKVGQAGSCINEQTRGVECRQDSGVVDEVPGVYKRIEKVMSQQTDLVQIVAELKQVVRVKG